MAIYSYTLNIARERVTESLSKQTVVWVGFKRDIKRRVKREKKDIRGWILI